MRNLEKSSKKTSNFDPFPMLRTEVLTNHNLAAEASSFVRAFNKKTARIVVVSTCFNHSCSRVENPSSKLTQQWKLQCFIRDTSSFVVVFPLLLLMEEILHHLLSVKLRKQWDKLPFPQLGSRISEPSTVLLP